jgi:hypothetical protein
MARELLNLIVSLPAIKEVERLVRMKILELLKKNENLEELQVRDV